ncbi:MAG: CusA/CzcA family heavy metal efflux RND transporter [Bacteroidia bacterium]|nr:CusA/CzcA family heavy metal efflux RND transporter [Bacteroidia bacterium]
MLNSIIAFSIRQKLIIGLFTIALVVVGIYQTSQLPIDAVPDITNNQVQIITIAPSYGATDIERLVTFPIEQAISNIPGKTEIRSFSRFGLSLVTIVFDDATDVYWARQQVSERLSTVQNQIPNDIGAPELGPITTGLGEIYQYVVRPEKGYESQYNETELRTIQDWVVRRQLLQVKGVADVSSFGGKLKQYEISLDPNRLHALGLSISDVFTALEKNNQNTGGAYIERGPSVLFIRTEGLLSSIQDMEEIPVINTGSGVPVRIKDVADVKLAHAIRYGAMCYNNEGEVAGAVVMMLKGGNSSEVIKNVKAEIEKIQKTLPKGVRIEAFLDRTKMVNNAISTVEQNLLEGALIVVFILVLFLGNWRAGLLVASIIPLSMLFAITLMNLFHVSGNLMSLGALDFGLIVDGAVIIVEAVMHQIAHSYRLGFKSVLSQQEMDTQVNKSASKMMNSAVFGQVVILIVYLPILSLSGIEGKMFKPMAQTVSFALIGAFLLSLTYVPMMASLVLSKNVHHQPNFSDRLMSKVEKAYRSLLMKSLRHPKTILSVVLILFVSSVFILANLGGEFIPALEEGDFAVETRLLTGSSLSASIEYTQKAAGILKSRFPEVEKVVTKIGSGEIPSDPMPLEAADLMVILKDKKEWTSASGFNELAEKMSLALEEVPGITTGFQYPVQMRFNELMTGARQDVVCKIFGDNLDTLQLLGSKLGKIIDQVDGAEDLFIEPINGMPQVVVNYYRPALAQYNLNIADVNRIVNTAFAGGSAGLVYEDEKRFDLVVRLNKDLRTDPEHLENLLIYTPNGTQIPLHQLAKVEIINGPNQIQRENAKRRIVVGFNVRNNDVQTVVERLQAKVDKELKLNTGYSITYGGAFENLNEAKSRLALAVPISLILVFLMLFFAFNSVKHGLLIYSAIPLSAIGGIFFLAIRNMPFSISAGVGFIALFGVAVLNGIVLISEFNRLRQLGFSNLYKVILTGTQLRLRPVLMTAFVASLGFLPMALSNGSGAEVQRPLATVVIGGLLLATFLTLFVLPILYILLEKRSGQLVRISSVAIIITFLGSYSHSASAQEIDLKSAIDSAIKNNYAVKNMVLIQEYKEKLRKSSFNPDQTQVTFETGSINSAFWDTRISINQSFQFPSIYSKKNSVAKNEIQLAFLEKQQTDLEITREVQECFFQYLLLLEKEKILSKTDSLIAEFSRVSTLRFEKGESNLLEKSYADVLSGNIHLQKKNLQNELELCILRFQLILNTPIAYTPKPGSIKFEQLSLGQAESHPYQKTWEQQIQLAQTNLSLQKAQMLPNLSLGLTNQSFRGYGSDNKFYTGKTRFTSYQVGVGIPLFFAAGRSQIKAQETKLKIAQNEASWKKTWLENQLKIAEQQLNNCKERLQYYENHQLRDAGQISTLAKKQFQAGDINFLDWANLQKQAFDIQMNYLDVVQESNNYSIHLLYLKAY